MMTLEVHVAPLEKPKKHFKRHKTNFTTFTMPNTVHVHVHASYPSPTLQPDWSFLKLNWKQLHVYYMCTCVWSLLYSTIQ